jgi:translation initiation factor IF-3
VNQATTLETMVCFLLKGELNINPKSKGTFVRINRNVTAPQVRVTKDGENLGIMSSYQAQELANSYDLDLVEIVATAKPPVCAIMDFGKWKFDEKKKQKDSRSKQKATESKEIRLRPYAQEHDIDIKIDQAKKFLGEKRTVFINIRFKNRELAHKENGHKIMERIIKGIESIGRAENNPKFEGSTLSVRLIPR